MQRKEKKQANEMIDDGKNENETLACACNFFASVRDIKNHKKKETFKTSPWLM